MRKFTGGMMALAIALGLAGCGGGGPAAGMPDDIPSTGVAPVMETKPITIKDQKNASKAPKPPVPTTP